MSLKSSRVGSARLREVLESGRSARTALFLGKALPGDVFRFSVLTPKKWLKDASSRNRARRRCREAFRVTGKEKPLVDLVVTARAGVLEASFFDLKKEAEDLLKCYSR